MAPMAGPLTIQQLSRRSCDKRQLLAVHGEHSQRADHHHHGQQEQLSVVAHGSQSDAQAGQVEQDGAAGSGQRHQGAERHGGWQQQQNRSDQLEDARTYPPPRLHPQSGEDVDRFPGRREFEEQSLQQDHRDDQPQCPTGNDEWPGVFHKEVASFPRYRSRSFLSVLVRSTRISPSRALANLRSTLKPSSLPPSLRYWRSSTGTPACFCSMSPTISERSSTSTPALGKTGRLAPFSRRSAGAQRVSTRPAQSLRSAYFSRNATISSRDAASYWLLMLTGPNRVLYCGFLAM